MSKKNKISLYVWVLLITVFLVHVGFHEDIWGGNHNTNDENQKEVIKKNNKEEKKFTNHVCFLKQDGDKKRIIILAKDESKKEVVGGDVFLDKGKIIDNYIFSGYISDNILLAQGKVKEKEEGRAYKISKDGIREGSVKSINIENIVVDGKTFGKIKDKTKITFPAGDNLIKSIDCKEVTN